MKKLAEIHIDLDAIRHNYLWIKNRVGETRDVLVMIKADAYGHGAVRLARTYRDLGVRTFGVAHLDEALELRNAGITEDIVVFQPGFLTEPETYTANHFEAVLNSPEDVDRFSGTGEVQCHLMVDTGMGREGMLPEDVSACLEKLDLNPSLKLKGISTHFACSDEADPAPTHRQINMFSAVIGSLPSGKRQNLIVHASNSGAIVNFPEAWYDRVRPGILLYGIYAGNGKTDQIPAMSVYAMLVHRKRVPADYPVGYGSTYRTQTSTDLGVFSVGYADAFLRIHSNRAHLWYRGEAFPVLGRVSMDQIVVDLKGRDDIRVGSRFTLFAGGQAQSSSLFEEAVRSSTITYERACQLGMMRIPRVYLSSN